MQLTEYLARIALAIDCAEVAAWGTACEATHKNVVHLEADTKILLHALDAAAHGATEITIHLPDTDVFASVFADILSSVVRQFHHWNRSKAWSNQVTANCAFPRYA